MHFTRLRLVGFKSFVEPTELYIEPGTTGIVGPNGCGKSNLVEALRWVMGETSPRRLRGGGMDDVIFAGTEGRPGRNIAEVSVLLDNADRSAPAAMNDADELEVVRRIGRNEGSSYAVNAADVRARDVQLLFADMVTGAHSSALVSQGQIGELIQAKPIDRRSLLEEAAGITGLHSRRHEAELRLRAAEANLEKLADHTDGLDAQLRALKRQARQASRYTNLSGHIRAAEALLLLRLWIDAEAEAEAAAAALRAAEREAASAAANTAAATTAQAAAAETVPPLRDAEAAAAARLQRLTMERENLDAEAGRVKGEVARVEARIAQIDLDCGREEALGTDAAARVAELERERATLLDSRDQEAAATADAAAALATATDVLDAATRDADKRSDRLTDAETRRARLAAEVDATGRRMRELDRRATEIEAARDELGDELRDGLFVETGTVDAPEHAPANPEEAVPEIAAARVAAADAAEALAAAETERTRCHEALAVVRETMQEVDAAHRKVAAERSALAELLRVNQDDLFAPLIDDVTVAPGYEAALAAGLGDDLQVSSDAAAPSHWRHVAREAAPALPDGAEALSAFVDAPEQVRLRLSQIGLVDGARGADLVGRLAQGQRLVSREGALWRWDGFVRGADEGARAAARLRQRNRHAELETIEAERKRTVEHVQGALERAKAEAATADRAEADARGTARAADEALRRAREANARAVRDAVARAERGTALRQSAAAVLAELEQLLAAEVAAQTALGELPDPVALRAEIADARARLDEARRDHAAAERLHGRLAEEAETRRARLAVIEDEVGLWSERAAAAEAQLARLAERRAADEAEMRDLADKPERLEAMRAELMTRTEAAERARTEAADVLAAAESRLAEATRAAKQASTAEVELRENRVRAEGRVEAVGERKRDVARRMADTLQAGPDQAREIARLKPEQELPPAEDVEARLSKLKRERETMGAVNLRAEAEAAELVAQLDRLAAERADLEGAIRKLRAGIGSLNREGRQRMIAAFARVDENFQELFQRLFGGGNAHLKLVESEDVLEAGLEIMASPPGKRLQALSLLSGGEQALTAIALRFAVFLTNPSPICVLDEVDAPLDDANVTRYCDLVEEISRRTATRFLLVTHHPQTMARMDRLYGVTMAERGISQLVSVDLSRAEAMREAS